MIRIPSVLFIFTTIFGLLGSVHSASAQTEPSSAVKAGTQKPKIEAQTPASEKVVLLEGQVTDYGGGGVADVSVKVYEVDARPKGTSEPSGVPIATTTTDRMGDFQIRVSKPYSGAVVVTLAKNSYTSITLKVTLDPSGEPPFLAEELSGNLSVTGRVLAAVSNQPIRKARVTLTSLDRDWTARTNKDGRFSIEGFAPGSGRLVVEADGCGRAIRRVASVANPADKQRMVVVIADDHDEPRRSDSGDPLAGAMATARDELLIYLQPERVAHITVVDEHNAPIAEVDLEYFDRASNDAHSFVTDEKGLVTIKNLALGIESLDIQLYHPDYVSSAWYDRTLTLPPGRNVSYHELTMIRAGSLSGRVIDEKTDKAIYGARIMTGSVISDDSPRDWSGPDGRFTITGITPGPATVTVYASGYGPQIKTADIRPGETISVEFRLPVGRVLSGIIKKADGTPAEGFVVETSTWRGFNTLGLRAMTGADGTFAIRDAPLDEVELSVSGPRGPVLSRNVPADMGSIEFVLPAELASQRPVRLRIGDAAPALTLKTLDGKTVRTVDPDGRLVILDFWATWCGPCVAELPKLIALHKQYANQDDLILIGISLDWDENTLRDFVKKRKVDWPQVIGNAAQSASNRFGVEGIPTLFAIGREGKILAVDLVGPSLEQRVRELLKSNRRKKK